MAKKDGRMKQKCEAYRRAGKRQINKDLKAKKHLARIEHFAKRKEEGKSYSYVPPTNKKERQDRAKKNINHKLPIQILDSLFGRLKYDLEQEELNQKKRKQKSASIFNQIENK